MSKAHSNSWKMGQSLGCGSVGSNLRRRTIRECNCGEETVIRTVTEITNRHCGKKFWGCRNYKNSFDKGCGFFKLVEEDVNDDDRDLKIEKLQKKNLKLKNSLENTSKWLKISCIFGLICFGVCLVLGTVLMCSINGTWNHMYLK